MYLYRSTQTVLSKYSIGVKVLCTETDKNKIQFKNVNQKKKCCKSHQREFYNKKKNIDIQYLNFQKSLAIVLKMTEWIIHKQHDADIAISRSLTL
jgi:hypothetical protein